LRLSIRDNGRGIPPEDVPRVSDPFYTSRLTRKVGLGLPLLRQSAEHCEGCFRLASELGKGTLVEAEFRLSHWDRAPLGDMTGTLMSLIVGRPEVDFVYRQKAGGEEFVVDTREIKEALDGLPLSHPEVIGFLRDSLREGLAGLGEI
ncbi:MAG: ATP-binding protein, partial [Thermodesulfobacteriota bacterium]